MRILVINRMAGDDSCVRALKNIPGVEIREENENEPESCVEVFRAFRPDTVMVWDPTAPELPAEVLHAKAGLKIWHPWSMVLNLREPPYSLFEDPGSRGLLEFFQGVRDLDELVIRVVGEFVPEVNILITDPDEFWQKKLQKKFEEIPGAVVHIYDGSTHIGDRVQDLGPEIIVMNWMDTLPPKFLRQYTKDFFSTMIAVFSSVPECNIIRKGPDVDFVLCKNRPLDALVAVVSDWVKKSQTEKRGRIRDGLLENQHKARQSS